MEISYEHETVEVHEFELHGKRYFLRVETVVCNAHAIVAFVVGGVPVIPAGLRILSCPGHKDEHFMEPDDALCFTLDHDGWYDIMINGAVLISYERVTCHRGTLGVGAKMMR